MEENRSEKVYQAALAGLLHDIGKFMWRARQTSLMEEWQPNDGKKKYGYWHALASDSFVSEFMAEPLRHNTAGIRYHHRPDLDEANPEDTQPCIVHLADQLSAAEREEDEDSLVPRLQSIYCRLDGYQGKPRYLPLKRLNTNDQYSIFPQELEIQAWNKEYEHEYAQLWDAFYAACKERKINVITDVKFYLENIMALLQEYTWCVPSAAYHTTPDISLFDHLRSTAAIAACLEAEGRNRQWCEAAIKQNSPVCLLVGVDLSGLQTFIYTLASSGAAKSLRARSFYLQLITEALAARILADLGIPSCNLIYIGGGGFELLVPLGSVDKLQQIVHDYTDRLLIVHQGSLGLQLCWEEAACC